MPSTCKTASQCATSTLPGSVEPDIPICNDRNIDRDDPIATDMQSMHGGMPTMQLVKLPPVKEMSTASSLIIGDNAKDTPPEKVLYLNKSTLEKIHAALSQVDVLDKSYA